MKNFILGFLTATIICLIVFGITFYPIYQKYKRYEAAAIELKVGADKVKNVVADKYKTWKNNKNKE